MTHDPEAAERLARRLLWAFGDSPLAAEAAALIRAQAAEIERLTVMPQDFRDYFVVQAAWERAEKRGAERMRERATQAAEPKRKPKKKNGGLHRGAYTDPQAAGAYSARQSIAKAIRALPLTEENSDADA